MSLSAPSQAAIGRALGLSSAAMTKYKRQGMPVHSVEAARRWRVENLDPSRVRWWAASRPAPLDPLALVQRAEAMSELASNALALGQFEPMRPAVQAALRVVPASHRHAVQLQTDVMDELLAWFLEPLKQQQAQGRIVDEGAMSDEEANAMGRFLYCMAAGENAPLP